MQTVNVLTIELQLRVKGSSNYHFSKKSLKYYFFSLRPSLNLVAYIDRACKRPICHDLDLPPFQ